MKDPILEILFRDLEDVLRDNMFDPTDHVLDLIWFEMSKEDSFYWDATGESLDYSKCMRDYMLQRTPENLSSLDSCRIKLYRLAAFSAASVYESQCWQASNDTRTDDDMEDYG